MPESADRPDPDELLRRISDEEARKRRAKLKIFFGFAPGVGKTYRMLQVARDLVIEQRMDIVVGLVETHRRSETASMLLGLDILARRKVEYRGQVLEEFDLDAALARKPKLLLLDELAHTNVPGMRHAKRWQDVMELLDAGIDVFTTVNVQHVESLNDVIAQITHVRVRETIPDSVLDRADEIELVDIAPEELLARLREGKVYMAEQARRAAEHFFQHGNLLALRELALRRTAQQVDVAVQEYRERYGVTGTWAASERILVCVGPAPSSARLIRAARRMAAGLRAPWVAVYVESAAIGGISEGDRERLETHLRLAESLGGSVARLTGTRVAEVVLGYARKHNVTHIVVGKPTHSRLSDRLSGSLLEDIVRGSADTDVHVISGDPLDEDEARGPAPPRPPLAPGPYASAALVVAATTAAAAAVRAVFPVPDLEVLYLFAVMIAAVRYGRGPSIVAAAVAVAAYDFFFVPPYYRFAVADARYFLTFAMMFGVGLLVSELASRIRRQELDALQREERTAALYALSRDLVAAESSTVAAHAIARHATEVFEAAVFVLLPADDGLLRVVVASPLDSVLDAKELGVAKWSYEHGQPAGLGSETLPGSKTVCTPLRVAGTLGVLALQPRSGAALQAEQREFLAAFCRQAAFALERARLSDEARNAALRAKTEEMRSSLLSAVSHDLRTPLAAITGAATSLREDSRLPPEARADLLDAICEEAERLERLVGNLLDMTRLESGAVVLKRDWVPVEEIVGSALTRMDHRLGERPVKISLPDDLPLVSVDPVLFEQVLVNLFDNAAKYTPAGSPLEIQASSDGRAVVIELSDRGPGLPADNERRVFEKFYRGGQAGIRGVGLGLPICKAIVEAHGGQIDAENRTGGGALFRVTIPLVGTAPVLSEAEAAHA